MEIEVVMLERYQKFILSVTPPIIWVKTRFVLHWITLPIKLLVIGLNSLLMHIFYLPWLKMREPPQMPSEETRKQRFLNIYKNLPVYDNGAMQLYVNRVDYYTLPDGSNHNTDHQCSRHATYSFILNKLSNGNDRLNRAMNRHMWKHVLLRGYTEDGSYNANTVSGDMLIGLSLGVMNAYKPRELKIHGDDMRVVDVTTYDELRDSFEQLLIGIIENDYSLLETSRQIEDPIQSAVWDAEMKKKDQRPELVKVKSGRAMFQPGLETVGAQSITLLAALKVASVTSKSVYLNNVYKKLVKNYGYSLLALFPTTFIPSKRGYFNDHNCLVAAYILSKLSTGRLEKLYWNAVALYIWSLSYPYYNGYFTGLVNDLMPGVISKKYIDKCISFLYEDEPATYSGTGGTKLKPQEYPVRYNEQDRDEFHVDKDPEILTNYSHKVKSGLGFFSAASLLELDKVKTWLA